MKGIWRKIRGQDQATIESQPNSLDQETSPAGGQTDSPPLEPPQLIVGCAQSVGRQRDHNEDALFTLTTNLTDGNAGLPFGLYIVADGMGGHQHGEIASNIAIRIMADHVVGKLYLPLITAGPRPEESIQEIMQAGMQSAHRAITKDVPGGGTTLTAALVLGDQVTIAHVGDSRAYVLGAEGQVEAVTRDHSLVRRLVELGQITHEEAATHPQRNVLYRALGQGEPFETDISTARLPAAGYLLLCSDGLWGVISETELQTVATSSDNPHEACQRLIDAANAAGGPDNITAVLVYRPR